MAWTIEGLQADVETLRRESIQQQRTINGLEIRHAEMAAALIACSDTIKVLTEALFAPDRARQTRFTPLTVVKTDK